MFVSRAVMLIIPLKYNSTWTLTEAPKLIQGGTLFQVTTARSSSCFQEMVPPLPGFRSAKCADTRGRAK